MRLLCPAKINLHLRVGRVRPADGFHPLLSWITTVGLFDTLTVEARTEVLPSEPQQRAGATAAARILLLSSDQPGLPTDDTNLVVRAADTFAKSIADGDAGDVNKRDTVGPSSQAKRAGAKSGSDSFTQRATGVDDNIDALTPVGGEAARVHAVAATLNKQIPLGAGLGGGSSDAARTLVALNRLWQVNWTARKLSDVAARLGSDVPFFLHGPSSICTGRGEVVRPVSQPRSRFALLILPDVHMPTPAVYRRFDEMGFGFDSELQNEPNWNEWTTLDAKDLLVRLVNDLEAPAFEIRPDLGTLRAEIELKLVRPVRMSGSGSSLFTLYDQFEEAESAAAGISARFGGGVKALAVEMTPELSDDMLNANGRST